MMTAKDDSLIVAEPLDSRNRLIMFGVVQVLFGGIFGWAAWSLLSSPLDLGDAMGPMSVSSRIACGLMPLTAACWLVALGVGSMFYKRWARALILVTSYIGLAFGVFFTVNMVAFVWSGFRSHRLESGEVSSAELASTLAVILGIIGFVMIVVPGILILFYKSDNTRRNCEIFDPVVRWTDRTPLPVLGVCAYLVIMSWLGFLGTIAGFGPVCFFGLVLHGWVGTVADLVDLGAAIVIAWGYFRLRNWAWWAATLVEATRTVSGMVTASILSTEDLMKYTLKPEATVQKLERTDSLWAQTPAWGWVVYIAVLFGVFGYTRGYFTGTRPRKQDSPTK